MSFFPLNSWEHFISVSVPAHQELLNRIVDSFPRTTNGLLGTLTTDGNYGARQMELFLLRNIAEYPISMQRSLPNTPLLTSRFRSNVALIVETMKSVVFDESVRSTLAFVMQCPVGYSAAEMDLRHVPSQQLWAAEVIRLETSITNRVGSGVQEVASRYDLASINLLRTDLATLLGVVVIYGRELHDAADAVLTMVPMAQWQGGSGE
ncbi:hypothetical protein VNI00_017432 [Paramarasmius palmivorus]|uniref:Uncharacterized protein n=1 Tax=Paramarasmius palmivorus TaxID=297713 RepID=A0AAW0B6K9_9AGAR